jgi:two-component system nitrogen regulation response regulator NtrX
MSLVLIVDDVPAMCEQYAYDLTRLGDYETLTAQSGAEALDLIHAEPIDCVILDLEMPGMDGFAVLRTLSKRGEDVPVIVYTGTGNYDRCVRAIKLGAYSFIDKAEPMERVAREIANAVEHHRLAAEVSSLRSRLGDDSPIIGDSPCMRVLKREIARVAPIPSPVLILGESGCGKELAARDIHRLSGRGKGPFVPLNCAALPENLVESELFGHERGAFTGAERTRKGAFEIASRGTLFLDEVGELPRAAQAKLLRVLEDEALTRLGGERELRIDTRVLAATHRDLESEIAAGRFRQDLLYRLNVHVIKVPPLRDRLDDVPALLEFFLKMTCERFGIRGKRISSEAVTLLAGYGWHKNNVRELRNAVERMVIASGSAEIGPQHVPAETRGREASAGGLNGAATGAPAEAAEDPPARPRPLKELKAAAERKIILDALTRNNWQITKTASELGLADHSSLLKIMRRHGLRRT